MCEPVTIAVIAAVAAAGIGTISAIQGGNAANEQAKFQAAVSRNNAVFAERQAADAIKRGAVEEKQQRLATSKLLGAQRSAFSANNVAIDSGSPLDVLEFTAGQGELDALIIRNNAARSAVGFRFQGSGFSSQSKLDLARGRSAKQAGIASGVGTILAGAGQFAGQFGPGGAFAGSGDSGGGSSAAADFGF